MAKTTQAYQDFIKRKSNLYFDFIEACREKANKLSPEERRRLTKHHIVPEHHYRTHGLAPSTKDLEENLVPINFDDHGTAHELRYDVYGEDADRQASVAMRNAGPEGMRKMQTLGGQAVNVIFRREGDMMFNKEYQKEMAARSMARPDALEIRSKGGKKGAITRNTNRVISVTDRYLWRVDGKEFMCTFGFDQGKVLCDFLNEVRPTKLTRISPLLGTPETNKTWRRSSHGWSAEKFN